MTFEYFHLFTIPFTAGMVFLFTVLIIKYVKWIRNLSPEDKRKAGKGIFSMATVRSFWITFKESLVHVSIYKKNPLLGFMHMSLAFGWFLLIAVGAMETAYHLRGESVMPHVHIFFKYFFPEEGTRTFSMAYAHIMDALLLLILIGVALAWFKRFNSRRMGMRKTTKHTWGDRLALTSLWIIFPARLLAESVTCGIHGSGGFLTGSIGSWLASVLPMSVLSGAELPLWWIYSIALFGFFISLPFSRYMHIFTEIPHIFLKEYGVRPSKEVSTIDNFHIQSCSRCGICLDACPMQSELNINKQVPVYFLRDQRSGAKTLALAEQCLMCGRCENACPVGVDVNMLRLNRRIEKLNRDAEGRYEFLDTAKTKTDGDTAKVGYFSGCMTKLTPSILRSMDTIFHRSGTEYVHLDVDNGVCCGRPLMLSGELDAARKLMEHNKKLIKEHGVRTLVTSCPICYKVFTEDYALDGVEVLHHTQYIDRLITDGKLTVRAGDTVYTYHDPCELGRGSGIYDEPRRVVSALGVLAEPAESRDVSRCCGSSLAHTSLTTAQKHKLCDAALDDFSATGAEELITACPLCKSAFTTSRMQVRDISEIVVSKLS